MKIATWNVNGIRARHVQVQEWIERERPDVVCLQELKAAPEQVPITLHGLEGYWCYWHGGKGYSGVGLHVSQTITPIRPTFFHPPFDYEHRIVCADLNTPHGPLTVASIYVPNGGKDFQAKIRFLEALGPYARSLREAGRNVIACGDLNVALTERDVHPKERKPNAIGQRPDERALLAGILECGLVDVGRTLDPENDALFTWWPPWRSMRQRNIGWRLDYVLTSTAVAAGALSCTVQRELGTSDHAPVIASFSGP